MSCQNAGLVEGYNWTAPAVVNTDGYVNLADDQTISSVKTFLLPVTTFDAATSYDQYAACVDYVDSNQTGGQKPTTFPDAATISEVPVEIELFVTSAPSLIHNITISGQLHAENAGDLLTSFLITLNGSSSGLLWSNGNVLISTPTADLPWSVTASDLLIPQGETINLVITPVTAETGLGPWNVSIDLITMTFVTKSVQYL